MMLAGILLAAGQSRRFGVANKLTAVLQGSGISVAVAALRSLAPVVDQVYATVAPDSLRLAQQLSAEGAAIIPCAQAKNGMGASLACAIRAADSSNACLVALADMPFIEVATMQRVAAVLRCGEPLAAACYHGKRGHPVGFARHHYLALSKLEGDDGAKQLLQTHADTLHLLATKDPGVLRDIDFPQDLNAALVT